MANADSVQRDPEFEQAALPHEQEIRAQLARIRLSPEFEVPERARTFLTYIVEETLAGRADRIKAYSIAIEVFGRDASFDASTDPAVRIEAARIRRALDHYYLTSGRDDPVAISIPKGSYVPVFLNRVKIQKANGFGPSTPEPSRLLTKIRTRGAWWAVFVGVLIVVFAAIYQLLPGGLVQDSPNEIGGQLSKPEMPMLVVEPFEDLTRSESSSIVARGLTEEVIAQIARFKEVTVVGDSQWDKSDPVGEADPKLGRFSLKGAIQVGQTRLRLTTRLIRRADGSVVWSNIYDEDLRVRDLLDMQAHLANAVATTLAQPSGIIFSTDAVDFGQYPPDDWQAYKCTLAYYSYRTSLNPQTRASIQDCLSEAVRRFPNYATAWALLSLTYIDEIRFRQHLDPAGQPPLDLAADAARHAIALDPQNVRGLEAEMLVYFFRHEIDSALTTGQKALALNPNDTEVSAEYGFRLALTGRWADGCGLIVHALERNPGRSGYYEMALALCAYMQNDYVAAQRWIETADLQMNSNFHYRFVAAAVAGQLGNYAGATRHMQWIEANAPGFLQNVRREIAFRIIRPEDQTRLMDGLAKAGMNITGQ